jgi:hypothetical protein
MRTPRFSFLLTAEFGARFEPCRWTHHCMVYVCVYVCAHVCVYVCVCLWSVQSARVRSTVFISFEYRVWRALRTMSLSTLMWVYVYGFMCVCVCGCMYFVSIWVLREPCRWVRHCVCMCMCCVCMYHVSMWVLRKRKLCRWVRHFMCMCMYVHMCVYGPPRINVSRYVQVCECVCLVCECMHVYAYIFVRMCVCVYHACCDCMKMPWSREDLIHSFLRLSFSNVRPKNKKIKGEQLRIIHGTQQVVRRTRTQQLNIVHHRWFHTPRKHSAIRPNSST